MKLAQRIELLHRSSQRMMELQGEERDATWWSFMRREIGVHFGRTIEAWWAVLWRKD